MKTKDDTVDRLRRVVERFSGRRVVVLGDFVADEFVYGDIARVSREAPVLILEHRRTEIVPGGGANSVANLRALGARPIPVGVVGRDAAGRKLLDCFRAQGVPVSRTRRLSDYSTPSKSRILAGGIHTRRQQIVRLDRGALHGDLPPAVHRSIRASIDAALPRAEGMLVADYGYGAATPRSVAPLLRRIRRKGLPVTIDSRSRVAQFQGASACTPNQEELENALELDALAPRAFAEAGRELLRRCGNDAVLVTQGAEGMTLFERRMKPFHLPAYGTDEVADVTGAGDTVIAVFTLALIGGATFADAARLANYAAGIVVTKAGTATVSPEELIQAVEEDAQP